MNGTPAQSRGIGTWLANNRQRIFWIAAALLFLIQVLYPLVSQLDYLGIDADLWLGAGQRVCARQNIYPQGSWALDNPDAPRENFRWGVPLAVAVKCLDQGYWPAFKVVLWIILVLCLIAEIPVWRTAFARNGFNIKSYWWLAPLLLVQAYAHGANAYVNLDTILIFLVGFVYIWLTDDKWMNWVLIGLMIAVFMQTKPEFILVPTAYLASQVFDGWKRSASGMPVPTIIWRKVAALVVMLAVAFGVNFLLNQWAIYASGDSTYGAFQVADRYRFLDVKNVLKDMPFYGPESDLEIQKNGIIQITTWMLGYDGMTNFVSVPFVGDVALSTLVAAIWAAIPIALLIFQAYLMVFYRKDKTVSFVFSIAAWLTLRYIWPQLEYLNLVPFLTIAFGLTEEMPKGLRWLAYLTYPYIFLAIPSLIYFVTGMDFLNLDNAPLVTFTGTVAIIMCFGYVVWRIRWLARAENRAPAAAPVPAGTPAAAVG